ncbi:MAG: phosphoglycerate mutase (2,3-diphosphoglycerate-independent) [Candidatus Moranbacteria bacterium RIFCSPHIGHO2_02_FULL_40_12b]|nr:MAG: phosphoglycerate mutase (2,3-diphosphoglycerate-independent) [Candidatus Moranbacteria bacterium RIFCSPHIGHO2_02_FULL_40_12b]OGI23066.1 MAG: phosphoglycerate mutase (2,3-diphosphoglycerate-independent) [Candidatus Moranbacteria bacterium RIFCSPHIGHO2_12_FULL_40_10]
MTKQKSPTILIILDGWGIAPPSRGNAITLAKTPVMDRLYETYPFVALGATGEDAGLDKNQMSGSEAGHMNIGAGRIAEQDSYRITRKINDGSFFRNPALAGAIEHVKKYKGNLHTMGLMGDSDSPHSNPEHFRAILKLAKEKGIKEIYCHLFTDGRDSYPQSALTHLEYFKKIIKEEKIGKIATICGRFYAMDRSKNWDRLAKAYDAIVFSIGEKANSAEEAIKRAYEKNFSDEYIPAAVICENEKPVMNLEKNDGLIFFNLRSDRARQFTKLFSSVNKERIITDNMPVIDKIENLYFVAMTDFGPDLSINTAFQSHSLSKTLPMILENHRQLYIAEMEKYAHLTYFFNGGYPDSVGGEERITVPSPKVDSYAQIPEMSAGIIAKNVVKYIKEGRYDFIAINFANADMVGHTGNLKATVKAIEFLDEQVGKVVKNAYVKGGNIIITADHGNADCMIDFAGGKEMINTFHSKNLVPFLLAGKKFKKSKLLEGGILGNIAPTILQIMEAEKPREMECDSLLK